MSIEREIKEKELRNVFNANKNIENKIGEVKIKLTYHMTDEKKLEYEQTLEALKKESETLVIQYNQLLDEYLEENPKEKRYYGRK